MEQQGKFRSEAEVTDSRSLSDIVAAAVQNIQNIFRAEMRLAAVELKEKFRRSAKAGTLLGIAGVMGFFAGACITTTCIVALAIVLPLWLSALVIGVMLAAGAGGAFMLGRLALEEVDPLPQQTLESLKDNLEWARTRAK